jgi:8-oxo-dGTP pyrophosphatase MutT (NUDIX family)
VIQIPSFCTQCQVPFEPHIFDAVVRCGACSNRTQPCYTALPPAAVALVVGAGKFVLTVTNRHYKRAALPGGKIEEQDAGPGRDDPIKFGCVRELKEEVGLVAAPHNLRQIYKGPGSLETGRLVFLYYVARVHGIERAQEKGTEIEWMSWEKLCDVGVFAPYYRAAFPDGVDMFKNTEWVE